MSEELRFEKLKKLLALTSSTSDNEALLAIRKANVILSESGLSWPEVFDPEKNKELTVLRDNYNHLYVAYNLLAQKYNLLVSQLIRPQIRIPQKRRL